MKLRNLSAKFLRRARWFSPLRRSQLLIGVDMALIPLALWLSFWLRLADPWSQQLQRSLWILPAAWLICLPIFLLTGQYKGLSRYVGSGEFYRLASRNGLLVLLLAMAGVMFKAQLPPRSSWLLLWVLMTGLMGGIRFALRDVILKWEDAPGASCRRVVIYGAGSAGAQLAASLRLAGGHKIFAFLDDSPKLWHRTLNGIAIHPPEYLAELHSSIDQVLLAIPSLNRRRRREIVAELQRMAFPVLQVPSVEEITSGSAKIDTLRPIAIEELLGRDSVHPQPELLGPGVNASVVCVTGAGGSIGSELCRQILLLDPQLLLLVEQSEPSLYAIEQELRALLPNSIILKAVLGNAADQVLMEMLFLEHGVQRVFHAAAYKHVPLVELNPLSGVANNVLVTRSLCRAAQRCNLSQMVLISTDKAVRPTNVMGASKRLAELVVQAFADASIGHTSFAIVRFGNVLGSSGSVVPLFRQQIASGGPITLTHPDIVRYFMTIPEAAQLVLQAAVLAISGDVVLLDMGKPVRIRDLAEQMVQLSGLTLRDAGHPLGDIAIECSGLRPGEKLYEELLIDASAEPTRHPLIYRARETAIPPDLLWPQLDDLETALARHDEAAALLILQGLVPEWHRQPA